MKREIINFINPGNCCPSHDKYPCDKYKNRRSVRQRALGIKKEHRHVRRTVRQELLLNIGED
ncbi:hypothetical protein [Escherichia coli]|uniref:hypothetical protein n=1 Tax=Escherichia coli TaxID=562 RepID=UPI000BE4CE54|nr:hypothetical protein [Escherichia coli]EFK7855609.1 hypothetical protein [Escherichia coli]EGH1375361.1 hypothetical protein [Escherichia coli]EGH1412433.1 hypothetical protein [Escherichia coli]ELI0367967.1 hypothetical protein [Escherichia coli]MDC6935586.1 hypothetical protein [Escherichia coli]